MPLSQFLFSLKGRVNRSDFWLKFQFPAIVLSFIVGFIDGLVGGGGTLYFIFTLMIFWSAVAVGVKRLQDRDKSGWMMLILLIPLVGTIWFFIDAGCLKGSEGDNNYGPAPA